MKKIMLEQSDMVARMKIKRPNLATLEAKGMPVDRKDGMSPRYCVEDIFEWLESRRKDQKKRPGYEIDFCDRIAKSLDSQRDGAMLKMLDHSEKK